jgi:hypothetical protein
MVRPTVIISIIGMVCAILRLPTGLVVLPVGWRWTPRSNTKFQHGPPERDTETHLDDYLTRTAEIIIRMVFEMSTHCLIRAYPRIDEYEMARIIWFLTP